MPGSPAPHAPAYPVGAYSNAGRTGRGGGGIVGKLLVRRVLLGLAIPLAITGTRALAGRAAARPGTSAHAPRLHQVADLLERKQRGTRRGGWRSR